VNDCDIPAQKRLFAKKTVWNMPHFLSAARFKKQKTDYLVSIVCRIMLEIDV